MNHKYIQPTVFIDIFDQYLDINTIKQLLVTNKEWNSIYNKMMPSQLYQYISSIFPMVNKDGLIISKIVKFPIKLIELDININKFGYIVNLLMKTQNRKKGQRFQSKIRPIFHSDLFNFKKTNSDSQFATITLLVEIYYHSVINYKNISNYIMFMLLHYCFLLNELPQHLNSMSKHERFNKMCERKFTELKGTVMNSKKNIPCELHYKLKTILDKL
jgi:hypothetical protein